MKLNNHGWGFREMLFLSAIILFFVILATVLIVQFYHQMGNVFQNADTSSSTSTTTSSTYTYTDIEATLKTAAERYYKKNGSTTGNVITTQDLIDGGYLKESKLSTKDDNCDGYVQVDGSTLTPYIICDNYMTEGY